MEIVVNSPMRFAVIGCGVLARSQHIPNIARSAKATLHTCCDLDPAALAECKSVHGALRTTNDFRVAVSDPDVDAICLATTERMRVPVIELAASLGKPLYVEKPIAPDLPTMYAIRDVVKNAGIPFCIGHNRRSSPAMIHAHRIFRRHMTRPAACRWRWDRDGVSRLNLPGDGTAGMSVRINDDWFSWKGWVLNKEIMPYGPVLFEMTHFTDLCNWFIDDEPAEVSAMETGVFHTSVAIKYRGGSIATISMCSNGSFGYPKELYEGMGNGGGVAIDHRLEGRTAGIANEPIRTVFPMIKDRHPNVGAEGGLMGWLEKKRAACEEASDAGNPMLQFTAEPDKGHASALDRFIDEIIGNGPEVCGIDATVSATRVAFAALRSIERRCVVRLEEV